MVVAELVDFLRAIGGAVCAEEGGERLVLQIVVAKRKLFTVGILRGGVEPLQCR